MIRPLFSVCALLVAASIADAGPIRNLVHRITHPFEGRRCQPAQQAAPQAAPQPLPEGPKEPAKKPDAKPAVDPITVEVFVPAGHSPGTPPVGHRWERVRCNQQGCV